MRQRLLQTILSKTKKNQTLGVVLRILINISTSNPRLLAGIAHVSAFARNAIRQHWQDTTSFLSLAIGGVSLPIKPWALGAIVGEEELA